MGITIIKGGRGNEVTEGRTLLEIYKSALGNTMMYLGAAGEEGLNDRDALKRMVYYGVKYINWHYKSKPTYGRREIVPEECYAMFNLIDTVRLFMAILTPNELINVFPIPKEYDGEKWETKDYYSAMEVIGKLEMDKPMGETVLEDVLWASMNSDLFSYQSARFSIVDDLRRLRGGKGMMEEFLEEKGVPSYTVNQEVGYMVNRQTGEIKKIEKSNGFKKIDGGKKKSSTEKKIMDLEKKIEALYQEMCGVIGNAESIDVDGEECDSITEAKCDEIEKEIGLLRMQIEKIREKG